MIIVTCVDDDYGTMFNNRPQSKDIKVTEDINLLKESCKDKDVCVLEGNIGEDIISQADYVVLYKWNRKYPHDAFFDNIYLKNQFTQIKIREFAGKSHEIITKEVYIRNEITN